VTAAPAPAPAPPVAAAPRLLEAEDVGLVYANRVRAVDRVSLSLDAGRTLSLVGESGSGKSSLARVVVALNRPTAGRMLVDGQDVSALAGPALKRFRRTAQMIFQDPVASLSPRVRIRDLLEEPLRIHGAWSKDAWEGVLEIVNRVGLPRTALDKYPHQVSGGQARRVGIARALVLRPRLLVADEPTAGLDVSVQGEVVNLLGDLQAQFGLGYLMVSHNLHVVRAVSDDIAVMYLGRIVEQGAAARMFREPAHPYTKALLGSVPRIDPERARTREVLSGEIPSPLAPPPGCHFHARCPIAQPRCSAEVPEPRPLADGRTVRCHFPLTGG